MRGGDRNGKKGRRSKDPEAAAALAKSRNREAVGRWISRALRPGDGPSSIARAIAEMKAEARAAGLTDAELTSKEQSGRGDHRMLPLDWIGIQEGTDKSSLIGDYLRHYERIFAPLRDSDLNLIEIGIFDGGSLRVWERFFTKAQIVGVDINPNCRVHAHGRVHAEIGSQDDPEFLHRIVTTYPPQIIIDDGSHRSDHIIFTFERLFPTLLPGGHYIVEDLHFHLIESEAERLRGNSQILATEYFLDLANERVGGGHRLSRLDGLRKHLVASIESIAFVSQAVIIKKQSDPKDKGAALDAVRPHVEASRHWLNWLSFGVALRQAGRTPTEIVEAFRTAVALNPRALVAYQRLSEALEHEGDRGEAATVLEEAIKQTAPQPELLKALESQIDKLRGAPST